MTLIIDDSDCLTGPSVKVDLVSKHSGNFDSGYPDVLVIHFTGGSSIDGAVSHLKKKSVKASAHLVVGREGEIVQLVEFSKKAWHAGKSEYLGRKGLNHYSIGIEIVNAGPLKKVGNEFVSEFARVYPANECVEAVHRN